MSAVAALAAAHTNPPHPNQERQAPNTAPHRTTARPRSLARLLIDFARRLTSPRHQRAAASDVTKTNPPIPHPDWHAFIAASPRSTPHLLGLVRALLDFGRHLADTLYQRTADTDLSEIIRHFGTRNIAIIIARITRGLLRATALETRLAGRRDRPPAAAATPSGDQTHGPRADPSAAAMAADPRLAGLPTPEAIAAEIRRRPVGAVIADICRDLGIVPGNPLWLELTRAIVANGGSFIRLFKDVLRRVTTRTDDPTATEQPAPSALNPLIALMPGTGPP